MRNYNSMHLAGPGDFIASVSGSTGDYDLTLDDGTVIEGYDETADALTPGVPAAGDLVIFGLFTNNHALAAANVNVVLAEWAAIVFRPVDNS